MVSIETFRQSLAAALPALELRANEPMNRHTTFRVGGPVTLMARPKSVEELGTVVSLARQAGIEPFFLGRGSNLLVADQGRTSSWSSWPGDWTGWSWTAPPASTWGRG